MNKLKCPNGCNGHFSVTTIVGDYREPKEKMDRLTPDRFKCTVCGAAAREEKD